MSRCQHGFIHVLLILGLLLLLLFISGAYKFGLYNFYVAEKAFTNKNYDIAIQNYNKLLQTPSRHFLIKIQPEIYYKLGVAYLLREKSYLAGANFHKYLTEIKEIKKIDDKKKFIIGATFAETDRYYQAIQLLENISPDESDRIFYKADYYNLLAESYLNKRNYDLALQNADKTLQIQNAAPISLRKAHIIKFLTYQEKGEVDNVAKEEKLLGSLGYDDLDVFESWFYTDRSLNSAQQKGLLQTVVNSSYESISQNQNLSPTQKAVILTVLATFYRQNGQLVDAEFYAKKAIEADPDYLLGYYEMGSIYATQRKFHSTLEYDEKAAKIDPNHPMILTSIGWNYYNLSASQSDDYGHIISILQLAEDNYKKALAIDPEFAKAHNNLGLVYFDRNQCEKATESFNLSIKYDPTYPKPVNNLGATYYEAQDYDKAIEYFKKSLEIQPDYARAYLNIGRAYYYLGDFQKSQVALQQDLKLDPYDTDAYLYIAKNYLAQDKIQQAIDTLNKALTITPDYPKLYFALEDAYKAKGDMTKSREAYEKAMSFFLIADSVGSSDAGETYTSSEYIYHYNRGIEYKQEGKIDRAEEAFKKAIEQQPGYTNSYISLSRIYKSKYGKDKSIELLQNGLKEVPESLDLYDDLGFIYKDSGDLDNALKVFQTAINKVQGNCDKANVARIFEMLGVIYYDQQKFDLAVDTLKKALKQNPRSSTIYTNLGATYIAKGDSQNAIYNLTTAIQLNPEDAVAHNNLGDILAQQGRINEAIIEFKKALEIDPDLKIAKENLEKYQQK